MAAHQAPPSQIGRASCRERVYISVVAVSLKKFFSSRRRHTRLTTVTGVQTCALPDLTLYDPIDSSPPGSPVPGILPARILEWVAISFFSAVKWKVKVNSLSRVQLFMTPWTSLPGSSVHRISQARVLEWVAIAFSDLVTKQRQIVLFASRSLGRAQVCWISALFLSPCSFDLICREDLSTGRNGPWFSIHAQGGPENEPLHLQKEFPQ